MKKTIFLNALIVVGICSSLIGVAQESDVLPGLSNYRIPPETKGALIGKMVTSLTGETGKTTLLKDTSNLFRINRKGYIRLNRSAKLKSSGSEYRYGITVGAKGSPIDLELVKDEFVRNKVIAHRGAWKNHTATENSLSSLNNAIETGCEASEFDVWFSSDKIPVVCHNSSVGGQMIEQTTAAELGKIPLKNGDFVPTLKQYLLGIKHQNKTYLVLEIKSSGISQEHTLELTDSVVHMVHILKAQGWVDYISFNYGVLKRIRELDPGAKTAYLSTDKKLEELVADGITGIDYPYHSFHKDENLVKKAHRLGLTVNVWTVDSPEELKYFVSQGVDQITTNEPEQLIEIIDNHK